MTREEKDKAIRVLDDMKVKIDIPKAAVTQLDKNWALDMAIEALKQEPCEDAISRAELKKWLDMNFSFGGAARKLELFDRLDKELPPVTPQPKTDDIKKSNFSQEQYKADLQSAYDCGKASVKPCKGERMTEKEFSKEFQNELLNLLEMCFERHTDAMTLTFEYPNAKMAVEMKFKVEKVENES